MSLPEFFVSCDWGTSSFRLRLVETGSNRVVAKLASDLGVRSLHDSLPPDADRPTRESAFASFLGARLDELLSKDVPAEPGQVMLSGMASSTIGWRELPYAPAPLHVDGSNLTRDRIPFTTPAGANFELILISGAECGRDIMRGEETELIGLLNHPRYAAHAVNSLVILPGTHSKHALVNDRRIESWRTFMTGELFEALTAATILRQTTQETRDDSTVSRPDFDAGVAEGFEQGMEQGLFHARVRGVLNGRPNAANRDFLSGLLIGSELRHAVRQADGRPLLVAGSTRLAERYRAALDSATSAAGEDLAPESTHVDLAEGAAAIQGHSFLLKQWLANEETAST